MLATPLDFPRSYATDYRTPDAAHDKPGDANNQFDRPAPNHTSLWDVVFLIARLPSAVCVIKKQIFFNPVLGGGARLAGYIANDGMSRVIRGASRALAGGGQLLLFPEGTRTRPDARWINPIKGGCAIIANRSNVPVYPIFIRSNTRFLQKGWPLWRRPVFPITMKFELGEPLVPQPGESSGTTGRHRRRHHCRPDGAVLHQLRHRDRRSVLRHRQPH